MSTEISPGANRDSGDEEQHEAEELQPDIRRHKQRVSDGGDHTEPLEDFQIHRHSNRPPWCPGCAGCAGCAGASMPRIRTAA